MIIFAITFFFLLAWLLAFLCFARFALLPCFAFLCVSSRLSGLLDLLSFACLFACLLACLLACLFGWLVSWFLACSPVRSLACSLARSLACFIACSLARSLAYLCACLLVFLVCFAWLNCEARAVEHQKLNQTTPYGVVWLSFWCSTYLLWLA